MRVVFHAGGAIATKLAPFVALALWPATKRTGVRRPVLLGLGLVQIGPTSPSAADRAIGRSPANEPWRGRSDRWNRG
jgi:hypothetical protein